MPLSSNKTNAYLLKSEVYLEKGVYCLGSKGVPYADLKMPFLDHVTAKKFISHAVAYLALVISYAKQWMQNEQSNYLVGEKPVWFVNAGLPSRDFEDQELVKRYNLLIWSSMLLSIESNFPVTDERVSQAMKLAEIAIANNDEELVNKSGASVHREQINVYPEIMAQMYGFLRSKYWDEDKPEFMLVDVGGGTLDSTIFNVTKKQAALTFNIFNAQVGMFGTLKLHEFRMNWLLEQTNGSQTKLHDELARRFSVARGFWLVPHSIVDYLQNARFGKVTVDNVFLDRLKEILIKKQFRYVLTKILPNFHWHNRDNFPFILTGGGSVNRLYRRLLESRVVVDGVKTGIELINLPAPDDLIPQLNIDQYHRVSVAYGLSFDNLGEVLTPDKIKDLEIAAFDRKGEQKTPDDVSKDVLQ